MEVEDYRILDSIYGNYVSFQEKIKPFLTQYKPGQIASVLEIGCGSGITTEIILSSRSDLKLTSIDISEKMVRISSKNLSSFSNVNFKPADALAFVEKQKIGAFDIVVSGYTIHNFSSSYRLLLFKEILRILKPKGFFINADKFASDDFNRQIEGLKYRLNTYVDALMRTNNFDLLKKWISHYVEDQKEDKILKFDKTYDDLRQIGFNNVNYIFKSDLEMLGIFYGEK